MKHSENIRDVAALRPHYMGFIFYSKSPRFVGVDFVLEEIDRSIERVAVSVDQPMEEVLRQAKQIGASLVQLHGQETTADCLRLKGEGLKVIKVFSVDEHFDFSRTIAYEAAVDFFLFDTKGKQPGGNAISFNWKLLGAYNQRVPFFLSGGLNSDNLTLLKDLRLENLHAIDVNSGVESSAGVKDLKKIEAVKKLIES